MGKRPESGVSLTVVFLAVLFIGASIWMVNHPHSVITPTSRPIPEWLPYVLVGFYYLIMYLMVLMDLHKPTLSRDDYWHAGGGVAMFAIVAWVLAKNALVEHTSTFQYFVFIPSALLTVGLAIQSFRTKPPSQDNEIKKQIRDIFEKQP